MYYNIQLEYFKKRKKGDIIKLIDMQFNYTFNIMRILWFSNVPLPEYSKLMNEEESPYGGWLINASYDLTLHDNVELIIAFPSKSAIVNKVDGKKIIYYSFPEKKISINHLGELVDQIKPDLIHLFGSELPHSISVVKVSNNKQIPIVLSIQGLVSMYSQHMYIGLPINAIYFSTIRNIIKRDNIYRHKKLLESRGKSEIELLKNISNVIGRTSWDKASVLEINRKINYYHCNETLREGFYTEKWDITKMKRNSIFVSQGHYPIKGLHFLLKALPSVLNHFPETKVYISGKNIINNNTIRKKLEITYYGKYINRLIKKLNLEDVVHFTGPLKEDKMIEMYMKSHIYVLPSVIENSPNSLGEAMILGTPCISSYCGGVPDMLTHGKDGFIYQTDAHYMLSYYIKRIFSDDELAMFLSKNSKIHANKTHDVKENTETLLDIYDKIYTSN